MKATRVQSEPEDELRRALRRRPLSDAQRELVANAVRLVGAIAMRRGWRWSPLISIEDQVSEAYLGVVEVAREYDEAIGTFSGFAVQHVVWRVATAVRKEATYRHYVAPLCKAMEVLRTRSDPARPMTDTDTTIRGNLTSHSDELVAAMFMATMADLSQATGDWAAVERIAYERGRVALAEAFIALQERDQTLLKMHYEDELALKEIAPLFGMSYATARRWHQEVLETLAGELRARGVMEPAAPALPINGKTDIALSRMRGGSPAGGAGAGGGNEVGSPQNVLSLRRRGHGV